MTDDLLPEPTDLPDQVNALAASPRFEQDGICFAAQNSGLYRSEDGGRSWHSAYSSLTVDAPLTTTTVALSPDFASDQHLFAGVNGGILRSVDGGKTWSSAIFPLPPPLVTTLAVSPAYSADGVVFAGTLEDGVFRSADRGASWAAWNFGLLDLSVLAIAISSDFANDETLFVGVESGLFRSENGGRAWREMDFPPELGPVLSVALSPNYPNDSLLFAGTETSGFFVVDDRANTWRRLGEDAVSGTVNGIVLGRQYPSNGSILVLLDDTIIVSRNEGKSWSNWQEGLRFEGGTVSIVAPQGLDPGATLLVGLIEGGVERLP